MMLSDNIRNLRKENRLSQDELAEKLGVSRQSISLWETGQTQPTIDNILALSRIFGVSSDVILGSADGTGTPVEKTPEPKNKNRTWIILLSVLAAAAVLAAVGWVVFRNGGPAHSTPIGSEKEPASQSIPSQPSASPTVAPTTVATTKPTSAPTTKPTSTPTAKPTATSTPHGSGQFDLFTYCKNFAIQKGELNGDYCIYQQPATQYGGYKDEYFSISYWGDSNMVEFCLHCPLDETFSINFYLRMRGGYNGTYEYLSSRYYRKDGKSLRSATGHIDPSVFSDRYPLPCEEYIGSADGQNEFMEESRVGVCDLIRCLKNFVEKENMECNFSDFGFKNF